jgi:hypothetical protein
MGRNNNYKFRKIFICQLTIFLLVTVSACSSSKPFHLENHLGLYKLVDKKCSVADNSFNPCDNTFFIELVKGQFIGIKNSEIAYVFWSGDPVINPELQYTAQIIQNHTSSKLTDNKFWLNNNSNTQEYFGFKKGKLSHYYVKYIIGDKKVTRTIEYTLIPAIRSSEPHFRLNYPGNK